MCVVQAHEGGLRGGVLRVVVVQPKDVLDAALAATPVGARLDLIATYTAMLDVRESLARRSGASSYWETPEQGAGR